MKQDRRRRDFLALMGVGGVVFASGLPGCGAAALGPSVTPPLGRADPAEDFFFLQLSDAHWGFRGTRHRDTLSSRQSDRLLRAHSPREPPHGRKHRASLGALARVPAACATGHGETVKRAPLPWDPASPDHGLGHRSIQITGSRPVFAEVAFGGAGAPVRAL
jgi:hypothetical protein